MSCIDINTAKSTYKGDTVAEILSNMAKAYKCRRIYKYANDFGDKVTHSDYKVIMASGDAQDQALYHSHNVHNFTLVNNDRVFGNEKDKY